ncbi:MAG: hypothetical protein V4858_07140 [Pseudomonadota bacterium]
MKIRFGLILAAFAVLASGCATVRQTPVALTKNSVDAQAGRIGVVMTALPKVDTYLPGAGCLLCLAVASGMNSKLTAHAATLSYEELPNLKNEVASLLRKNGAAVTVIEEELDLKALPDAATKGINLAGKDFSSLQRKHQIDRLLVINVNMIGFERTYSGYIPTSDPKSLFEGLGYIVNLKTNTYDWYQPVRVLKSADQAWDEPPKFPGLTNAYFQSLEMGKDQFLQPFAAGVKAAAPAVAQVPAQPLPTAAAPTPKTIQ